MKRGGLALQKFGDRVSFLLIPALAAASLAFPLMGAQIDPSKLPPAATAQIDFTRDIKPILDNSCIRCHGPEKPKSRFRLDNRAAALKGGEDGVDILPGRSAESPLIHYVARLVPDLEMPPKGKGEPLTSDQIGLLRAWIDQGPTWGNFAPTNALEVTVSPTIGGTFVSGDNHKFREHYWRQDGFDAGLERFELFRQTDPETTALVTGHAWLRDYKITLDLNRNERGFIHTGWEQYRKYYDDTGGYFPSSDPHFPQSLGSDLHLDIGKAWVDFGLTLPHWPRMVLGYEYDYKRGEEATTSWGSDGVSGGERNIAPTSKRIDEGVHVIKFDFDAEVKGVTVEDRFRGEFYKLNTHYTNVAARNSISQDASEQNHYFQGANSIRLEKQFKDWLFGSGGYFYSKLNADDSFTDTTVANEVYLASVPRIQLTRESHVFNLNGLLGPFDGLTISAGAQSEWTRQHGFGSGDLNGIAFTRAGATLNISPATVASDYDQNTISETAGLRYTKIPFTVLFADARLKQESIEQFDSDIQTGPSFLERPSFTSHATDFRAGFNTSPWEFVSFSAHYRRYENDSRYKTNEVPQPIGGYPGLISRRDQVTDEIESKLVLSPYPWLKTTLSYQIVKTDYNQETRPAFDLGPPPIAPSDGGNILAGKYDSHIYSLGATFTPHQRLYLSTVFSYQDTTTSTPYPEFIPPYKGGVYSALISGTYVLNQLTDLSLSYSLSLADYSQDNSPVNPGNPPPLGIRYQQHALQAALSRRFNKNLTGRLQYGYFYYDEPTLVGANNYKVHSIFATLTYHFP